MKATYLIEHYLTAGRQEDPYAEWLERLRDRRAKIAAIRRVNRIESGNFGNHKYCRDGVWELRIELGPGYRIYYAHAGPRIVLLLGGGAKRTQDADIGQAVACWNDWQRRNDDEKQTS